MNRVTRRWLLRALFLLFASGLAFLIRPLHHLIRAAGQEETDMPPLPEGTLDDASRMSGAEVQELVQVSDRVELAEVLDRASEAGGAVAISGVRSTMGGQALVDRGTVLDMTGYALVRYKPDREVVVAGAGATWSALLSEVDGYGRSPAIAPALADCTVGGALSVNAYGPQVGQPPIAAGVVELQVMLADGAIWRCSREENEDLFAAVLGGYGLIAVILEATLATVPNVPCTSSNRLVALEDLASGLVALSDTPEVELATASLSLAAESWLQRAAVAIIRSGDGAPQGLTSSGSGWLRDAALRGSIDDEYGKWLRWQLQSLLSPLTNATWLSRNTAFNSSIRPMLLPMRSHSLLLVTLFVPPDNLATLVKQVRLIVAGHDTELVDARVNYVGEDHDTVLRYATGPVCALQLTFREARLPSGEYRFRELTRTLTERAIDLGGSFFLPYRRHASQVQLAKVYANQVRFLQIKQRYDPHERFQSSFYRHYINR